MKSLSHVQLFVTPWTSSSQASSQASSSMGFSRQEHWTGLPFPSSVYRYVDTHIRSYLHICICMLGFPGGSVVKSHRCGFNPWVRKSPGEGNGNPVQYSCLENPMDRGTWWAVTVHGVAESDTTEVTQHKCMHV